MKLPKDLLSEVYTKPKFFLCETDKTKICQLETTNTQGSFKFNSLSELSFEVARVYTDISTGEERVNPYYDKIEALRLIYVEGFGYFELQGPELIGDGIKESKSCTAYSLEYILSQKYLEDFYVNTGETKSIEVINSQDGNIIPVTLYNANNKKLSLLHLILEKVYGWSIGHVDTSLQTLSRQFEIDRESVYDFLMNEVCEKFNCYIVFNTVNNTIDVYAESLTAKFIGDGSTNKFIITPPFADINTVSVDGYKTTQWEYDISTGILTLEKTPDSGARIEIVDGALTEWETDVFVSFDNLAQEININYDADSIKTVLTVTYGDEGTIREVNLGLPYLTDLSYYYTVDWMGQDLYDAYTAYLQKSNKAQSDYAANSQEILELQNQISVIKNKMSLGYGVDNSVNEKTVGTYYVVDGGSYPHYTYKEVQLPADYNVNTVYYRIDGVNVTEEKVHELFSAIRKYFVTIKNQKEPEIKDIATKSETWSELLDDLTETNAFKFVEKEFNTLKSALTPEASVETATAAVETFLDIIWGELGYTPLEKLYLEPYKEVQTANAGAGFSVTTSEYYWYYYPVTLMIASLEKAIKIRKEDIAPLESQLSDCQNANNEIADSLLIANNFTEDQLIRLNGFLREDELQLDDIIETSLDDINGIFKVKQDAMESGRIELQKLCQPQLQFSMSMANIYALPEFEPIIHQFQLGNVIKVALRPDYIKQSRLLQVDMNFDDLSDFSCEFGELTNLRTQSDIHADLLSKAISAGKSVATNSSYWTRGSDIATSTDLKIQQGLLDATTQIKAIDGNQGIVIDKYGIKLQKKDLATGELDPHQTWMTNNMILFSNDGFKTSRSALGEVTIDGQQYYGLIAEVMLSGYIESTKIKGGTIEIGETTDANGQKVPMFSVNESGHVTINAANISGYTTSEEVSSAITQRVNEIKLSVEGTENGSMIKLSTDDVTISSGEIVLNGFVTFNSLEDSEHTTTINGAEINTGDINSANINSGTIKIGKYTNSDGSEDYYFKVDEDGKVTISAPGSTLDGYVKTEDLNDFSSTINNSISNLQEQIDGSITTWFEDGVPTVDNQPASTWTDEATKNAHLGDLYYNNNTGYCYRWQVQTSDGINTYSWKRITDTDITKALDDAKKAQDTADGKRRVFTTTPYPPYDIGDLWAEGSSGDLKRCKTAKSTGSYSSSDWESATKYTDDTRANAVKNEVITGLATKGQTIINGDNITTGTISADRLNINDIFAKNITARGAIFFDNDYYSITGGQDQTLTLRATNELVLSSASENGIDINSMGDITLETSSNQVTINGKNIFVGECGTSNIQYGSTSYTVTVTFQHKFSTKPIVLIEQPFQNSNLGVTLVKSGNIYTGFQIKNQESFNSSGNRDVCWAAFGTAQKEV